MWHYLDSQKRNDWIKLSSAIQWEECEAIFTIQTLSVVRSMKLVLEIQVLSSLRNTNWFGAIAPKLAKSTVKSL